MTIHPNYINDEWAQAASAAPDINPSNVSDVVGEYARADETQVRAALAGYIFRPGTVNTVIWADEDNP